MLPKYQPAINQLHLSARTVLVEHFHLPHTPLPNRLWGVLHQKGLTQADVVMALLSAAKVPHIQDHPFRQDIELLIGKPVTVCPPQPHHTPYPTNPRRERGPDDLVVTRVVRNPRLPTTDSFQRFKQFRPGVSVQKLLTRGVTRKDLREARQHGWVEFA